MKRKDITGEKFNKLTAIEFSHVKNKKTFWKYKCDCERIKIARMTDVSCNKIKSCGCLHEFIGDYRICVACKKEKHKSDFYKRSLHRSNYYRSYCKECEKKRFKEYRKTESGSISSKKACRKYHKKNRDKIRDIINNWRLNNKEYINTKSKKDYNNNARIRIKQSVSSTVRKRLKKRLSSKEGKSTFTFLPYTIDKLILHLEKQFTKGMNLDNYGKWHIDHIIADCKFDYKSVEDKEFQECWALNNLQPLWAKDNLIKNKY